MGQELTSADGYTGYLLDQEIDQGTCIGINRSWSGNNNKCFKTAEERCKANGSNYIYENALCKVKINEGVILEGALCHSYNPSVNTCSNLTFTDHSICTGYGNGSGLCKDSLFDNSLCISNGFYGACSNSTFSNDSVCYAREEVWYAYGCASATYNDSSCCCGGSSCPNAYRCSETRCQAVEEQVTAALAEPYPH